MTLHLTRRTMLTTVLGTAGVGLALGARPASAAPLTPSPAASSAPTVPVASRRGRFVDVAGWPVTARVSAFSVGASGTWAFGQQYDRTGLHSSAILRRRSGAAWSTVALPATFRATASAAYADATGAWVAGTRNDVSLPVADGSSVVGHVSSSRVWRNLGTAGLPAFLSVGSLRVEGSTLLLTGMRPSPDGSTLRPYAATKPVAAGTSVRWTSLPVDAPAWDSSAAYPLLQLADGAPTWATAGPWVLRRQGTGWTVVDTPPGTTGQTKLACTSAQGQIHVLTEGGDGSALWRRTTSTGGWTRITLPTNFVAQTMAGDADELWLVGQTEGGEDFAATAVRVVGGKVVATVGGPLSAGGPVGILDHLVIATDGPLAAGYRATAPAGDALGWTCRPVA